MARVSELEMISSTVAKLVVEPDAGASPISFIPGQYVHLSVPGTSEHHARRIDCVLLAGEEDLGFTHSASPCTTAAAAGAAAGAPKRPLFL